MNDRSRAVVRRATFLFVPFLKTPSCSGTNMSGSLSYQRPVQSTPQKETPQNVHEEERSVSGESFSFLGLVADTVLAYLFWTTLTMLVPTIWFAPMDKLGATGSGEEFAYLSAFASPVLLFVPPIRRLIYHYSWFAMLLTLVGLPNYLITDLRLRSLTIYTGTALGFMIHFAMLWAPLKRRARFIAGHMLGLLAFTASRFAFSSLWPVWLSTENLYVSLGLGVLFALTLIFDPDMKKIPYDPSHRPAASFFTDMRHGLGFGVMLFTLHWVLSEHGVIARWLELDPFLFGIAMLGAMTVGILLSHFETITRAWTFFLAGLGCSVGMLYFHTHGWREALFLVVYLSATWRLVLSDMATIASPARTLLLSGAIYVLGHIGVVWSVAWNFVPEGTGGPFMRDRAYQVFVLHVLIAGLCGIRSTPPQSQQQSKRLAVHAAPSSSLPPPPVLLVLFLVIVLVVAPAIYKRNLSWHNYDGQGVQKETLRGMAWAVRFGYNNRGYPNHAAVAAKIREVGANVIGLVETDTARPFNANWDVVEYLEEHLHMYSDYGPPTTTESWGCAILSAYPILRSKREIMPSPFGETACYIDATILVNGEEVDVLNSHFGNTQHVEDRSGFSLIQCLAHVVMQSSFLTLFSALQADFHAARIAEKKRQGRNFIWLGYLTDKPGGSSYTKLTNAGAVDASPQEKERYCIYLFHRGFEVSNYSRIDTGVISDTEIQIANFNKPKK